MPKHVKLTKSHIIISKGFFKKKYSLLFSSDVYVRGGYTSAYMQWLEYRCRWPTCGSLLSPTMEVSGIKCQSSDLQ